MALYDDFKDNLLPGNYALTKSMELTKISDSGTLWYTKKFLTLYYFIFLSNDIMTIAYRDKIIEVFDSYIESIDTSIRDIAIRYFYPENEAINFKSENFNYFSNFANYNKHANQKEREEYYHSAKKYYFSLLMGSGGQTGIKKQLKEAIQQPGFVYSHENIDKIILQAAIDGCKSDVNAKQRIDDNSIKYIISDRAIKLICEKAAISPVDEADIRQTMLDYPLKKPNFRGIENDMVAFIRNERQILYYYGYFHSKSSGVTDFEFSSLTPIGELALNANFYEFLAIWEHQKIKMISQPAIADINYINGISVNSDKFDISYTPYTDILGCLARRDRFSLEEYKYIISRKKAVFDSAIWENEESYIFDNIADIKGQVASFGRQRDEKDEDGRKELLKYLLGVRSDLPVDNGTNPIGVVKISSSNISITNKNALVLLYSIYSKLDNYKIAKYQDVYRDSQDDLKRRYADGLIGISSKINGRVKIYWDLYNIHADTLIMLGAVLGISAVKLGFPTIENLSHASLSKVCDFAFVKFKGLLKSLGMKANTSVKKEIQKVVNALKNENYSEYIKIGTEHDEQTIATYREENANDLMERISQISQAETITQAEGRIRNTNLINLLKSYYMARFSNDNKLVCECCGEETFITDAGQPYVEFHHLIPFNIAYGPDHYLNLFALCPNCHRKIHFLRVDDKEVEYVNLSKNNYLHLCFKERLMALKEQNLLKSYHLEFLLEDKAITQDDYDQVAA